MCPHLASFRSQAGSGSDQGAGLPEPLPYRRYRRGGSIVTYIRPKRFRGDAKFRKLEGKAGRTFHNVPEIGQRTYHGGFGACSGRRRISHGDRWALTPTGAMEFCTVYPWRQFSAALVPITGARAGSHRSSIVRQYHN